MPKQVMERRASDNEYLHKDFHGALSSGIEYLHKHFGEEAVREYLRDFTTSFYAPLISAIRERGLAPLKEHFERVYAIEGGQVYIEFTEDEMVLTVEACPAVIHMRRQGYPIAAMFSETTRTVNDTLCEGTPFAAELVEHDEETGRSVQRFHRRSA